MGRQRLQTFLRFPVLELDPNNAAVDVLACVVLRALRHKITITLTRQLTARPPSVQLERTSPEDGIASRHRTDPSRALPIPSENEKATKTT